MAANAKKKIEDTAEKVVKKAEKAVAKAKEAPAVKKAAKAASTTAKKAATTAKKAASTTKKAVEKVTAYVEFDGRQISTDEITDKVRAAYRAEHKRGAIKSIEIYVKPEENAAYYVVNGKADGKKIDL